MLADFTALFFDFLFFESAVLYRSVDTPTKFIKYGTSVIAQFLCTLYNKCIVKGNTLIY